MRTVRLISLIARVALMVTLGLGLGYWIAQLFAWNWLLLLLAQIGFPNIHEVSGSVGVLGLLILGAVAVWTRRSRQLGVGSILYSFLVPVFGMIQTVILGGPLHWLIQTAHLLIGVGAMMLILRVEKCLRQRQQNTQGETRTQPPGKPCQPIVARLARLAILGHIALYRLSGGSIAGQMRQMPVLLLTTRGRKSGKPRTTALVYLPDGNDFVVVASNGGQARLPNWFCNLRQQKQASIEVGRKRLDVRVQEATASERQRLWSRIIAYRAGHEAYQERTPYPLPLVILHPIESTSWQRQQMESAIKSVQDKTWV